jgi:hypothetical protein
MESPANVERAARTKVNRVLRQHHILPAMIEDLHEAIGAPPTTVDQITADELELFDLRGDLPAHRNHAGLGRQIDHAGGRLHHSDCRTDQQESTSSHHTEPAADTLFQRTSGRPRESTDS